MAALAVQTKQPIAGFQPVDHDVLKAFASGNRKAVVIEQTLKMDFLYDDLSMYVDFNNFISVRELVFLPPEGWVITDAVAELIGAIFIDVNGGKAMNLVPGLSYSGAFIVQRTLWAQNLNNIKLTLEVNGELVGTKVVDLMKIPADTWVYLEIADFQANRGGNVESVSLTNHDRTWKTGLKIAGAVVHPAGPGIKN